MMKQIGSALLAALLLAGSASANFTDIAKPSVRQAAEVLNTLGIMQGTGTNRFQPSAALTRAQFCKLAVTALGIRDVSTYRSYTIFPDLPASHWAAGYVNAAMKDSSIKNKQIIRGLSDGTFAPDKAITYGETCTMLLRMLGYTVSDVGPFWPQDYITKAQSLGLTRGVSGYGAQDVMKRGDAAVLLLNTLQATPKEGDKLLSKIVSATTVADSILLATPETDSSVTTGQARFYESGSIVMRKTGGTLDSSLVGLRGTVLLDKDTSSKVCGFLPDSDGTDQMTVRSTTAKSLVSASGQKYAVDSSIKVVVGGEVLSYSECYFDLVNSSICVYYDADMQIEMISRENAVSDATFIYGTASAGNIQSNYKILKNGAEVSQTDLKKYDVVTLDTANRTAYVCDQRISGYMTAASPLFSNPGTVTVCGKKFTVSGQGAAYFAHLGYGDRVTLLLDRYGTVCGAYPASEVFANMIGQFIGQSGGTVMVRLLNGMQISGALTDSDEMKLLLGKMVSVSEQKGGSLTLAQYPLSDNARDAWMVKSAAMGTIRVSAEVKIFESVDEGASVSLIGVENIRSDMVPAQYIRSVLKDSSGTVMAIVLHDYTGDGWQYGIVTESTADSENLVHTYSLRTYADGAAATQTYTAYGVSASVDGQVVGLPKGMAGIDGAVEKLPVKTLQMVQEVGLSAFDGVTGVKTAAGYYSLADDVGVYVERYGKMISLREAKAVCTQFSLYADTKTPQGGRIRVILAK